MVHPRAGATWEHVGREGLAAGRHFPEEVGEGPIVAKLEDPRFAGLRDVEPEFARLEIDARPDEVQGLAFAPAGAVEEPDLIGLVLCLV